MAEQQRYEAITPTVNGVWWSVFDRTTGRLTGGSCTEAEAKIIAWALNGVTEGKRLRAEHGLFVWRYDGPTEGVAPR